MPNFDEISQSTVETKLVSENGWPPYWNFTSSFDFDIWPMTYPHVILHPSAKFHSNRLIG